jgi:hypothetical protein
MINNNHQLKQTKYALNNSKTANGSVHFDKRTYNQY